MSLNARKASKIISGTSLSSFFKVKLVNMNFKLFSILTALTLGSFSLAAPTDSDSAFATLMANGVSKAAECNYDCYFTVYIPCGLLCNIPNCIGCQQGCFNSCAEDASKFSPLILPSFKLSCGHPLLL